MAKSVLLADHVTDPNQQVQCFIVSAKVIDADLFDVVVKFSDGSKGEGEMLSSGGRVPAKDQEWKLTMESRKQVPTIVPVLDKDGKETKETTIELQDRDVVVGYSL